MLVSKSSGGSRNSKPAPFITKAEASGYGQNAVALILLTSIAILAATFSFTRGYTLYDGDAEAHLNIARRLFDSRTPGPEQLGTVWLPLPHLLLAPFAAVDTWWKSGFAGVIPSAVCYVIAGGFLFSATSRAFKSTPAGWTALLIFALNPNVLYLATVPMTEMIFAACLAALLWAVLWYSDSPGVLPVLFAAVVSNEASLTRYEGWLLIPAVALILLFTGKRKSHALLFTALAAVGPLAWLAHNQYYYSNPLEFYASPWSAMASHQRQMDQGVVYPTDHNWRASVSFYLEAVRLAGGAPLALLAGIGVITAAFKGVWSPLVLLLVCPVFYIVSLHSGGVEMYVPTYWPFTVYNTRYALPGVIAAAFAASAWVTFSGPLMRVIPILFLILCSFPWLLRGAIVWQEARTNSEARRIWTKEAANFLAANYRQGSGIFYAFGDLTAILREAGIPLKEGLHEGNHPVWDAAVSRPEYFLREEWIVSMRDSSTASTLANAQAKGRNYHLRKQVVVKGATPVDLYHLE